MYTLKIENTKNDILTLTQNESDFQIFKVEGLNPPQAQINVSKIAGLDGSKFNSSKLLERNIVIYVKINGDIEANRLRLYKYFNPKEWCKIYYKNGSRDVFIEGYAETIECDIFSNNEIMQISILCPNPYFKAVNEIVDDISKISALFEFPFSINANNPIPFSNIDLQKITNVINDSESDTGLTIEIEFLDSVNKLEIKNIITGEDITLNHSFLANDTVIIDTNKGSKSVSLIRGGIKSNIFTSLKKGSIFFQLSIGDNFFSYLADSGASDEKVFIKFSHYTIYRGV